MKIEIKDRFSGKIILCGEYESIKDCLEKNRGANLSGANLSGANLSGANLSRANLENYSESHDIFMQLIRERLIKFTVKEQEMAGRVFALRLCWDSIKKEYGKKIIPIFKKLSKLGWNEYEEEYKEVLRSK